jgi:hypothetical protein
LTNSSDSLVDEYCPSPVEIDHVSHSQLDKWRSCPKQWEYRYVHKLREPSSGNLILGGVYHSTLEENFKQKLILGHDLDFDICADYFSTLWDKEVTKGWNTHWGNSTPGNLKDKGIELVGLYLDEVAPSVIPQFIEQSLTKDLNGTKFVIRIDLIDMNNVVIDHKTSSKSYTQNAVDKDTQASATAFALGRPIAFQNHVAVKTKSPQIQVVRTYRTHADINWWYRMAVAIIEHMKTGYAPPNDDSWLCSEEYCGFFDLCRKDLARTYR